MRRWVLRWIHHHLVTFSSPPLPPTFFHCFLCHSVVLSALLWFSLPFCDFLSVVFSVLLEEQAGVYQQVDGHGINTFGHVHEAMKQGWIKGGGDSKKLIIF